MTCRRSLKIFKLFFRISYFGVRGLLGDLEPLDFGDLTESTSSSNVVFFPDAFFESKSNARPLRVDFGVAVAPLFGVAGIGEAL